MLFVRLTDRHSVVFFRRISRESNERGDPCCRDRSGEMRGACYRVQRFQSSPIRRGGCVSLGGEVISPPINPAQCMAFAADYGLLEKGRVTDFLIVDDNPLHNLASLRRPSLVTSRKGVRHSPI